MVSMLVGKRGTGKTKKLIEMVKGAAERSKGNVVCIEKGDSMRFDLNYHIRLIDIEEYRISGAGRYYGFIAGLLAGNYDITDVFCDATFKILSGKGEPDYEQLAKFIEDLNALTGAQQVNIVLSVSAVPSELPERIHKFIQK